VEGFGLTCLEAMASECAVIATETGVFPEIIDTGENGWVIPCEDTTTLAERLAEATANDFALTEMGRRARERVLDRFTIEKTAEQTAGVYDALLDRLA